MTPRCPRAVQAPESMSRTGFTAEESINTRFRVRTTAPAQSDDKTTHSDWLGLSVTSGGVMGAPPDFQIEFLCCPDRRGDQYFGVCRK
jgi:hypothetical protein